MSLETLVDLRHVTVEDVTEGEHLVTLLALVLQNKMEKLLLKFHLIQDLKLH